MSENKKLNTRFLIIIGGLLSLVNLLAGFLAYPHLPDRVPTHWNWAGEVDGWGSAWQGAFMLPLIMIGIFILLIILPKIDPKKRSYAQMGRAYSVIVLVIMFFFTILYFGTLGTALGYLASFPSMVQLGVGALFIILGNYMGKLKHNYFIGIRTPWTLANEEVWYRTHRMAGPFWIIGGLLFMGTSFLTTGLLTKTLLIIIFGVIAIPVIYSYVFFKRLEKE
jgi:uncharacterized membrane protein